MIEKIAEGIVIFKAAFIKNLVRLPRGINRLTR